MGGSGQRFSGLPTARPRISFLEALSIIEQHGFGAPHAAKQLRAYYVLHTGPQWTNRPIWVVDSRGIPPITPVGTALVGSDQVRRIPVDRLNHMRDMIDAQTGEWLEAGTMPQPVLAAPPAKPQP